MLQHNFNQICRKIDTTAKIRRQLARITNQHNFYENCPTKARESISMAQSELNSAAEELLYGLQAHLAEQKTQSAFCDTFHNIALAMRGALQTEPRPPRGWTSVGTDHD